ncbi:hypothetical protein BaRGS_00040032, partial [Batillaria attramentaria]
NKKFSIPRSGGRCHLETRPPHRYVAQWRREPKTTEHVATEHDVYTSLVWFLCVVGEEVDELLVAVPEGDNKTTCTTSTNGVSANITCHLPEDVSISKRSVSVDRFDLDSPSSSVNVYGCVWLANGNRRCHPSTGYTCDDTPTTTLTVTVNELSSEFEGIYTCQVIPSRSEDIENCTLVLKDATTIQPVNSTSLHTENMTHTPEDGNADVNVAWIVVPIVVVIVAVVVVSVVCIIRRQRRLKRGNTCYSEVPQPSSGKNSHLTQPETSQTAGERRSL